MHRLIAIAVVVSAAALGGPARAEVLIGLAGPMTGKEAWLGEQFQRGAARRWPWPTSTPPAACSASRCN